MGKLHELLAVEKGVLGEASHITQETIKTFKDKKNLFEGQIRTFEPFEDLDDDKISYNFPDENVPIITSVKDKLNYFFKSFADSANAIISKEETNLKATATVEIGGKEVTLGATTLLSIEKMLNSTMKKVLESIPTTTVTQQWKWSEEDQMYKSAEHQTIKMKKIAKPLVRYEATKEHPAQVDMVTEDVPLGKWHTTFISKEFSQKEASEILSRLSELTRKVTKARIRANQAKVEKTEVPNLIIKEISG